MNQQALKLQEESAKALKLMLMFLTEHYTKPLLKIIKEKDPLLHYDV